ncbi:MAG: hypothetical protein GWP10_16380, partial [Nitrospiraceae bacterium]|nr:hypothetical protein [Nitrospiraceae bacterium]
MNMPDLALIIADKLRKTSKHRLFWARRCLEQALATSNYKKAIECLNFLIQYDKKNAEFYTHKAFDIAIGMKDYRLGVRYAEQILKLNPMNKEAFEFLEFYYSSKGQYLKVIKLCLSRLAITKNYKEKATYFKTAINIAMWHGNYRIVKTLIRKYGYMFLNNRKLVAFMLKAAMATGDSKFSEEVADKVFSNM